MTKSQLNMYTLQDTAKPQLIGIVHKSGKKTMIPLVQIMTVRMKNLHLLNKD